MIFELVAQNRHVVLLWSSRVSSQVFYVWNSTFFVSIPFYILFLKCMTRSFENRDIFQRAKCCVDIFSRPEISGKLDPKSDPVQEQKGQRTTDSESAKPKNYLFGTLIQFPYIFPSLGPQEVVWRIQKCEKCTCPGSQIRLPNNSKKFRNKKWLF